MGGKGIGNAIRRNLWTNSNEAEGMTSIRKNSEPGLNWSSNQPHRDTESDGKASQDINEEKKRRKIAYMTQNPGTDAETRQIQRPERTIKKKRQKKREPKTMITRFK